MKKTIIAAAAVTAAAVMLSGCSGDSHSRKGSGAADRPESWAVEQRTLEDITPMSGEEQVYVTRDEETGEVKIIQGVLSDFSDNGIYRRIQRASVQRRYRI